MDFTTMSMEELEARKAELLAAIDAEGADIDAIDTEARALKAEIEARKAAEAKKAETRKIVAEGGGTVTKKIEEERKETMTREEIRKSPEYVEAYARYIKTGRDAECRAILTQNAPATQGSDGPVPVPVIVDEIVRTAWERDEILSRVRKTNIRGNLKVAFELSADGAVVHAEGSGPVDEENLAIGIVNMVPATIKKFVRISDEAVTMGGEAFLRYIYDELTYQIIRKLSALVIGDIAGAPAVSSASAVGVPQVSLAPSITAIGNAFANLSDEATDNVVIMNKLTFADFNAAYAAGQFAVDPFLGMKVLYTSALPAYSAASSGDVYAIVGDLKGAQVNYPEGEGVAIKYDDLSEAEADMVKVVGKQYAAHAVTAPGRFVNMKKA